ncbi:MAG: (2Fe-2S) ferredoxin domain-containing protein [Candidatus Sumerlaeia bacterium]
MNKPEYHFFVCASFRASGEPQGVCHNKNAIDLIQYIENEILDRCMDGMVSSTGCLKLCDKGPVMIVYPQGDWYGEITEEKVDEILDALEDGGKAEDYLIA